MHLRNQGITIVPIESSKTTDLRYLSIKQRLRNSNSNFEYSCFLATKDVKDPALFIFLILVSHLLLSYTPHFHRSFNVGT